MNNVRIINNARAAKTMKRVSVERIRALLSDKEL